MIEIANDRISKPNFLPSLWPSFDHLIRLKNWISLDEPILESQSVTFLIVIIRDLMIRNRIRIGLKIK